MKYEHDKYDEDGRIIYFDDTGYSSKEPPVIPDELKEQFEETIKELDRRFKAGEFRLTQAPTH